MEKEDILLKKSVSTSMRSLTANKVLDKLFKPSSIAVVGASNKPGTVGYSIMNNILNGNFNGKLYPINLRAQKIHHLVAFSSLAEIKSPVDLAVIATPARTVYNIIESCADVGIKAALIITAGFKEVGAEGKKLYLSIQQRAAQLGIRIIGPNCVGLMNPHLGINASFLSRNAIPGNIAMISQSGALCASILDWAYDQSVGFSHFVSVGSMMDIDFGDLINYFGEDEHTNCIMIYMESLQDAEKFLVAAKTFTSKKPIVVLKSGKSGAGAKAAMSHTGSLAGNDRVYDAAFRRAGIIRVNTIAQLFNCAQGLAMQDLPLGKRMAIVTNAGGPGVLATDCLMSQGGELAALTPATFDRLNQILPSYWSHNNPVDVLGSANVEEFSEALHACLDDENTDALLAIFTTQGITDPLEAAEAIAAVAQKNHKPVYACWMGEQDVQPGRELLEKASIPNFRYPESAVEVFINMARYADNLSFINQEVVGSSRQFKPQKLQAEYIISNAIDEGRFQLLEPEAKALLRCYEIPTVEGYLAHSAEEAGGLAERIGFPVVLKIVSPDIGHKTDVGGVQLNVKTREAVERGYEAMIDQVKLHNPEAIIKGVLVEKMASKQFELLIGSKRDSVFGPVVLFGIGGVLVELIKDTNMELTPLNELLALRMIQGTKAYKLISGYRGMPKVNISELVQVLLNFSALLIDFPIINEVDLNPFVADDKGMHALDALIILDEKK